MQGAFDLQDIQSRILMLNTYTSSFYRLPVLLPVVGSFLLLLGSAEAQPDSSADIRSFTSSAGSAPATSAASEPDAKEEFPDVSYIGSKALMAERAMHLNERGVELFLQGKRSQGSAKVKQALAHDPQNPNVLYNLAGLYLADGRADLALPVMRKVISMKPRELAFQDRYAESCVATRELDSAIRAYETIEQEDASYNEVLLKLSALYAMREQWTKAEQAIRRAHAHLGDNPRVLSNFGAILVARGKFAEAVPILEKSQTLEESGENAVALGMSFESLGESKKAIREYTRALKLGTHDDEGLKKHLESLVGTLPYKD